MKLGYLLILMVVLGCSNLDKSERIEEKKMAQILADIHIDEANISTMAVTNTDSSLLMYHYLERKTLKRHGVDSLTFVKSLESYAKEPTDYIHLYEEVKQVVAEKRKKAQRR
jgi:hypothetical protein